VAILFALQSWGDRHLWHHMNHLPSSSLPSIRTWDQVHWETLASKWTHYKVKRISRVGSFWNEKYNHCWNHISYIQESRQLRNYNCKYAKEIQIHQFETIYTNTTDTHNVRNSRPRTTQLWNLNVIPDITTSCYDLFWLTFHAPLY